MQAKRKNPTLSPEAGKERFLRREKAANGEFYTHQINEKIEKIREK